MRITHHVTTSTFVLVALFFCGVVVAVEAIETEDESLLLSFDAARETWLQNASLYGTYTFKRTGFYSEEEALTKSIDDKYIVARGTISKLKDKYRLQAFYVGEPSVHKSSDRVTLSRRSSDRIVNKNYRIDFNPEQGNFEASGSLGKVSANAITSVVPELRALETPFSLFLNPIAEMPTNTLRDQKYSVTRLEGGRELLSFTSKSVNGNKFVKEITIRTNEKNPLIEQIVLYTFGNDGNEEPLSTWIRKVVEWKICGGVGVPYCIREVVGPLKPIDSNEKVWMGSEWRSDDLDARPPTDKDFVLQLPPDVGLNGMNHYPKGGIVDIDAITDDDFLPAGRYYEQETWGVVELEPNRHTAFRWTFMILGIALIMWGLVRIYMKRK